MLCIRYMRGGRVHKKKKKNCNIVYGFARKEGPNGELFKYDGCS